MSEIDRVSSAHERHTINELLTPLRPGEPAPFEAYVPPVDARVGGRTLCQAVEEIVFHAIPAMRRSISMLLARIDRHAISEIEIREQQMQCWRLLLPVLQNGTLTARGIVDRSRCNLFPEEFDHAEPDFVRNTLSCAGRTYHRVRISLRVVNTDTQTVPGKLLETDSADVRKQTSDAQTAMREAWAAVLDQRGGQPFKTRKEGWRATLRHLGYCDAPPRGYSEDSFARMVESP